MLAFLSGLGLSFDWTGAVSIYEPSANGSLIDIAPINYLSTLTATNAYMDNQPKVSTMSAIGFGYFKNDSESLWNALEPFSVSIWVQYNSTTTNNERFWSMSDNGEQHVALVGRDGSNGQIQFYIHGAGDPNPIITPTINVGDWFLITAVMDGTNNYIYYNDGLTNASASSTTHNQFTHIDIGANYDETFNAVHYSINQIVFWNKSLIQSEISALYNGGSGVAYTSAGPPDYLNITYLSPGNLNVTDNNSVLFEIRPEAKSAYINCSLDINGTIYGNTSAVVNNSVLNWTITLANSTYSFNMSCYTSTLYNSTDNYILNVLVPNVTLPEPNYTTTQYDVWGLPTLQLCLSNTTLFVQYNETIIDDTGAHLISRSKNIVCTNGCDKNKNACNPPFYESLGQLFLAFIAIIIVIALIYYFVL